MAHLRCWHCGTIWASAAGTGIVAEDPTAAPIVSICATCRSTQLGDFPPGYFASDPGHVAPPARSAAHLLGDLVCYDVLEAIRGLGKPGKASKPEDAIGDAYLSALRAAILLRDEIRRRTGE